MTPLRWQLVSFDLDGTLVDTAGEIAEAANAALAAHGLEQRSLDEITRLIGGGFNTLMRRLVGGGDAEPVVASAEERYGQIAGATASAYPGCADALAALHRAGVLLACVTNKEHLFAQRVLAATGLDGCFSLVVGGDTLAVKKPDAGVLRHVAETLGVGIERMAHVGDSAVDVAAARNAGAAAWCVPYGYNAGLPIADARPDRIFDDLRAVAAHVLACS